MIQVVNYEKMERLRAPPLTNVRTCQPEHFKYYYTDSGSYLYV